MEKAIFDAVKSLGPDAGDDTSDHMGAVGIKCRERAIAGANHRRNGFDCRTARDHGRLWSSVVRCQSTYARVRHSFGAGREARTIFRSFCCEAAGRSRSDWYVALRSRYLRCWHLLIWLKIAIPLSELRRIGVRHRSGLARCRLTCWHVRARIARDASRSDERATNGIARKLVLPLEVVTNRQCRLLVSDTSCRAGNASCILRRGNSHIGNPRKNLPF